MNAPETHFPASPVETDITDKTDIVDNGEFLIAAFGNDLTDALPVVVSFAGHPSSVSASAWTGTVWQGGPGGFPPLPSEANNYFSLAAFRPDEAGRYRRQKARFQALYAVMLDDVGTKVAAERLTLSPSWLLETSPGNHQPGICFVNPLLMVRPPTD